MSSPISVDTDLLSSESFQAFRSAIAAALNLYDDGADVFFPFGEDLTPTDLQIIAPIVRAHPQGQHVLETLLAASGGDATKVSLMSQILETAEAENVTISNFHTTTIRS